MTVWTSYQGVEVKDSDPTVQCRHPRYGYEPDKLATLKGASLLALADGVWLVVCDTCGFNGITGREPYVRPVNDDYPAIIKQADSLLAHINAMHHPKRDERVFTRYKDDQIKVAIKIWLKWKGTAIKHWTQAACDELTTRGFKPYSSPAWTPSQLGSLVRHYIKLDQFKNLKAGPMDDDDKAALAEMVREAQSHHERAGGNHVADTARITTRGGAKRQTFAEHKPVDFAAIIGASEAAKQQEAEEPVRSDPRGAATPTPTLSFAEPEVSASAPRITITVEEDVETEAPAAVVVPAQRLNERIAPMVVPSDFTLVSELEGGVIVFTYQGRLMAGKPVKGVEI